MEKYCDDDEDFGRLMGMKTGGNLKDCACQGDQITATNLNSYSNCESLYNGLILFNITDLNGLSALSRVKTIHEDIDIQNTNIQNTSFLKSLKMWKVRSFKKLIINLQNNPEMKRLPVEFFRELENILYGEIKIANFENLHPDFCLTIEEILMIFDYELSFLKLHAKLCDEIGNIGEKRLCKFESMNHLPNGCNIILGDLIIENGDEENMSKLMKLELIVGSIIIRNTELKKFQHFGEVLCIIQFDDTKPVIQIVGNKQLKDPTMDEITNIITRENRVAVIQDNHPDIFSSGSSNAITSDDLQHVLNSYQYDPKCVFNYTEVNSKTIKHFPTCGSVFGIIVINNNTDVSATKLETAFRNMGQLVGGTRIENSTLKSLEVFKFRWFMFYCSTYGFYVLNNPFLTNMGSVAQMGFYPDKNFNECTVRIENNKKLNMDGMCEEESLGQLMNVRISGNLEDCGCDGANFSSRSINQFCNCDVIFNGLSISNISEPLDLSAFSNVYVIKGPINIQNPNIQNLSFFENLNYLRINTNDGTMLNLQNNPQMTRLAFSNLTKTIQNTNTSGFRNVNFENLHPDFCVTLEEFLVFFRNDVTVINLHGKLCEVTDQERLCIFKSMKELPSNCFTIIGDLIIENGDEEHVSKLLETFYLYGTLQIRNTKLPDLGFLYSIMMIVSLNENLQVIQIIGNKNLTNPVFGIMASIITRGSKRDAIIQDNHPDIFNKTNGTCEIFGYAPDDMKYRRRLNFIGGDCGAYIDLTGYSSADNAAMILLITVINFFVF
ncbi:hypothetical protein CAEBREN_14867 [Caenorhabditis brenneri]|uniref:Receptor L-domain domain-containing protein n=1 Tax=Caenorhabditis brenneri TaxID=135651 RepID=G0MUC6_CAEBE|nr:hypothetical protein CAEBREN_14867 [Caenorhabditis brenneri]